MRLATALPPAPCRIDRRALEALVDDEAADAAWVLGAHVRQCSICAARLRELVALQAAMAQMRQLRASALDPLRALNAIARRPVGRRPVIARLRLGARWAWTFQRGWCCLAGLWLGTGGLVAGWVMRSALRGG